MRENMESLGASILERAIQEHRPRHIFCLFSGGHDSLTATHFVMQRLPGMASVVHIDTGIGIPETQQFVVDTCARYGWPLKIYRATENTKADGTPDPQDYDQIVLENGFPGPGAHRIMYSKLKQRQIRRLVREHKQNRADRIMLVSGVRRQESKRRMGNVAEIQREGAQVWVAPLMHFSDTEQHRYMVDNALPRNPVKDRLCMSGECLCGAFAHPGELKEIEFWYPEVGARIRNLEKRAATLGHRGDWEKSGWGKDKSESPTGHMCSSCDARMENRADGVEYE